MKKYVIILILYLIMLAISFEYIIIWLNDSFFEGFGLSISAFIFDFICIPFIIYLSSKEEKLMTAIAILMMVGYTITSFLGLKLFVFFL